MKNLFSLFRVGAVVASIALAALLPGSKATAQTVSQLPQFAAPGAVKDVGNGPVEFRMLTGSMAIFTAQGSGVGSTSGSSTTLTLTTTPLTANTPLIGGVISGNGITAGTTITAWNSGLLLTLSAAMTVPASTALSWGMACPATQPTAPVALVQASVGADLPFYTYARICAWGGTGPGGQYVTFPIGAH